MISDYLCFYSSRILSKYLLHSLFIYMCLFFSFQFGGSWQPKTAGTSENDEDADTFIQAVNILLNLWLVLQLEVCVISHIFH